MVYEVRIPLKDRMGGESFWGMAPPGGLVAAVLQQQVVATDHGELAPGR